MMNTRARVSILLADGQFGDAISEIEKGRERDQRVFPAIGFSGAGSKEFGDRFS